MAHILVDSYGKQNGEEIELIQEGTLWQVRCWDCLGELRWSVWRNPNTGKPFTGSEAKAEFERWRK